MPQARLERGVDRERVAGAEAGPLAHDDDRALGPRERADLVGNADARVAHEQGLADGEAHLAQLGDERGDELLALQQQRVRGQPVAGNELHVDATVGLLLQARAALVVEAAAVVGVQ